MDDRTKVTPRVTRPNDETRRNSRDVTLPRIRFLERRLPFWDLPEAEFKAELAKRRAESKRRG